VSQVSSLKALALRVLREGAGSGGTAKSCPTAAVSERASGTGQEVGQTVGQMPTAKARVRGRDAVTESAHVETGWHCHGEKVCRCMSCAVPGAAAARWEPGQCAACQGSGFLCWPEGVQ
jgi:hypothetical protein